MMTENSSFGSESSWRPLNYKVIIVQVLVASFLCVNFLLIVTFSSKEFFYTTTRYILFALTLLSDSLNLILSDIMLILTYFRFTMQIGMCFILYMLSLLCTFITPITLTAMALERFVAICMPLQHAELCSMRNTLHCILIIHSLSTIPLFVILTIFFASASNNVYTQYRICSVDVFVFLQWHGHVKLVLYQFYFFFMCITIVFVYVKIMKVAKAASGKSQKTRKGLRTVILHAFQLLLGLIHLWCPSIEAAVLKINFGLYINLIYFNYITFYLAPKCLSPLIYGLRDEKFFLALKYRAAFVFLCTKRNMLICFV